MINRRALKTWLTSFKRSRTMTALLLLLLVPSIGFANHTTASPHHPGKNVVVPIQYWQTAKGTQVYLVHDDQLPFVDINVIFYAGSSFDGPKPGLAQFTNNLIPEGSTELSADQIADHFERVGAQFSQSVNRDVASFTLRTLTQAEALKTSLTTLSDIINHPDFPRAAFLRLRDRTLNAIKAGQTQPATIANQRFYKALYGEQGYGHPSLGLSKTIKNLTLGDVRYFYKSYYLAANGIIVMVGDITRQQAERFAKQLTADLPKGGRQLLTAHNTPSTTKPIAITFPATQSNIRLGQVGISRSDPNYFSLMVGNYILGGGALSSILSSSIREKYGLTYGIYSQFVPLLQAGPFVVTFSTRHDQAQRAIKLTQQKIADFIKQGPTAKQLNFAKNYLIGSFPIKLDNNARILVNVSQLAINQLPLDYLDTYVKRVKGVTQKQVREAFNKTLDLKKFVTVTVGPTTK